MDRKTLLPYLLGAAILVPLIVEGGTLVGLIRNRIFGSGSKSAGEVTKPARSGQGDIVLPETEPEERLEDMVIRYNGNRWIFHLALTVTNRSKTGYEYRFVTLGSKQGPIKKMTALRRVSPGAESLLRVSWELTPGTMPTFIEVAVTGAEKVGSTGTYRIKLADVPVKYTG